MSKTTKRLKAGESVEVNGASVLVVKCGMHSQGGEKPEPTVTIEIESKPGRRSSARSSPQGKGE